MYDYIDIHSHLNFAEFDADREDIIRQLKQENIATITVGTGYITSHEAVDLADTADNLYASIGLHPVDFQQEIFDDNQFEKLVNHKKVVAVGECGLDYARLKDIADQEAEKRRQKAEFEKQIEFAVKHDLPMMFHCRDAYPDALDLLASRKKEHGEKLRGNFHFFTSPVEIAKRCLENGFTLSFTGPITFAKQYEDLVRYVPLESMMAETDSPYAAPAPYRGKRNSPLYIKEIVTAIAKIRGEDLDRVRKQIVQNAFDLFLRKNSSALS